ncbi:MAG: exodeoxyribonuclease V subunit alpha [Pseudomonadales bacterium]|nr:exodeoxyribonuclease V subunit alpha [Pseudomonadales bacterium]
MIPLRFDTLSQQVAGLEAIDFYLARDLSRGLLESSHKTLTGTEQALLFNMLLALHWFLRQGNTCLPVTDLAGLSFGQDREKGIPGLQFPGKIELSAVLAQVAIQPEDTGPVVLDREALYLRRYWIFECEVAEDLRHRMQFLPLSEAQHKSITTLVKSSFPRAPVPEEIDWQRVAVANAVGRRLSIISGGPGTGKTFTVTRVLLALQALHEGQLRIEMAAPTGKAAQRLKESISQAKQQLQKQGVDSGLINSIPETAKTLHRLLGFRPRTVHPRLGVEHPLRCDLLLIDEVSMIDIAVLARVLRALPEQAILIMLGDADQLPSVEVGSVMADLTCRPHPGYSGVVAAQIEAITGQSVPVDESSRFGHLTLLTKTYRFGGEIGILASAVIQSDGKQSWALLNDHEWQQTQASLLEDSAQVTYIPDHRTDEWLKNACLEYYRPMLLAPSVDDAFQQLSQFRLLTPTRVGNQGVVALNDRVEQILLRSNMGIRPGQHYRGRPIMVTENHYGVRLFNGDIGLVWTNEEGHLVAYFEDSERETDKDLNQTPLRQVNLARLPAVETVYAMTIHKTQGSEFQHVAIVLPEVESAILSPELLYTGITRAKQHVSICTSEAVWKAALKKRAKRYSGLAQRL